MTDTVMVEVIGLAGMTCSPFPCDEDRSCGLTDCSPTGDLESAFAALRDQLDKAYEGRVRCTLTLVDSGIPPHVREIIETCRPPLPIILIDRRLTRIGRISLPMIRAEIDRYL
jgi:hypothetical protein